MNIAFVLGGLPFGGVERLLLDLLKEFKRRGGPGCRVFNLSGEGVMAPDYLAEGIEIVNIAGGNKADIATHRLDTTWKLRNALKEYRPDIIHTMHYAGNYHGRMAALGLGVPVITHLHNIKHEKKLTRRVHDFLLSYATDAYLAVSKAVAEVVRQDHNRAGRPVEVLYNALAPERMALPPLDFKAEFGISGPVILFVGRYVPQKNPVLLVKALDILLRSGVDATLVLVGEGGERAPAESLRDRLGLGDRVLLTGFRDDVAAMMKSATVFAVPSAFEGFSVAHMEAMYCGLPAVITKNVPSLEIAAEAVLVCETTAEDIAGKLKQILTEEKLRSRLSTQAREIAGKYTIDKYAVRLLDFYERQLAGTLSGARRAK